MVDMQGGCLCGKLRYRITADPVFTAVCHCRNCQKGTGSAFSAVLAVPSAGLSISGTLTSYVGRGESGQTRTRRFCPECGSPITDEAERMPGITMVEIGTLDDPSAAIPAMHIYCRSKLEWMVIPENVGAFQEMPPAG